MKKDLNQVVIMGRFGRTPELKTYSTGTPYVDFSLANHQDYKQNDNTVDQTYWIECRAIGKSAEIIAQHCKAGTILTVVGTLSVNKWTTKEGDARTRTFVNVDSFYFSGSMTNNGSKEKPMPTGVKQDVPQTYTDIETYAEYAEDGSGNIPF